MRLFIAVPIADPVRRQLAGLQQPIRGVRWQKQQQMHLTLKFLGDTSGEQFQELLEKLPEVRVEAFSMTLQGFGYFLKGKKPRVLWAGVKENPQLLSLQSSVEQACTSLGFESEQRPFKPHVTIARVNGGSKNDVMSFINQHKQFKAADVPVDSFVLYESKLHPDGARYHRRKEFPLSPVE